MLETCKENSYIIKRALATNKNKENSILLCLTKQLNQTNFISENVQKTINIILLLIVIYTSFIVQDHIIITVLRDVYKMI